MRRTTQEDRMRKLAILLESDSYISGEKESGPNGAKKVFLNEARTFLKTLGKDLHFTEQTVTVNPGGIAVSGGVTLRGQWQNHSGVVLTLEQFPAFLRKAALYRPIFKGSEVLFATNQWVSLEAFHRGDYFALLAALSALYGNDGEARYGNVA